MLYFRFNTDNFIAPQQTCSVTSYRDGKPVSEPYNTTCMLSLGEIQSLFFKKLRTELGLDEILLGNSLYDVLEIPVDALSIDDESINNCDKALKFVLSEYAKFPITELGDKSLHDMGIDIEFCKRIANNKSEQIINRYMQQNGLSFFTEEVLWKNKTVQEKATTFSKYLHEISADGNELIIVDPYLFSDDSDEYCDMLALIINEANAKSIVVITDPKNINGLSYNKVAGKISITLTINNSKDYHDRFWISNRKKGFYTGTSLNGIGKKISLINLLTDSDVEEIVNELQVNHLI